MNIQQTRISIFQGFFPILGFFTVHRCYSLWYIGARQLIDLTRFQAEDERTKVQGACDREWGLPLQKMGPRSRVSRAHGSCALDSQGRKRSGDRTDLGAGPGNCPSLSCYPSINGKDGITSGALLTRDRMEGGIGSQSSPCLRPALSEYSHSGGIIQSTPCYSAAFQAREGNQRPAREDDLSSWPHIPFDNPDNICYMNSVVNALGWVICHHLSGIADWNMLGEVVQAVVAQHTKLLPELLDSLWLMLGWDDWHIQHDAAEFLGRLLSKMPFDCPALQGEWGCFDLTADGGRELFSHSMRQSIPIPLAESSDHSLQNLIDSWSVQEHSQGLHNPPPPMICLQLLRYTYSGSRVVKICTSISSDSFDSRILIPVFVIGDQLEIAHVPYRVMAIVVHHGPTPDSGHYTTQLRDRDGRGWWTKNDTQCYWHPTLEEHVLKNAYLVFLSKMSP